MIPGNYLFPRKYISQYLGHEVYYLHPTDEREASEEPHGSSYGWQLVHKLGCSVLQSEKTENKLKLSFLPSEFCQRWRWRMISGQTLTCS